MKPPDPAAWPVRPKTIRPERGAHMPANNPGPPPVQNSVVRSPERQQRAQTTAETNYITVVDTLKSNNGADARAIRAMFGGDKRLMDRFLAVAFSLLAKDSDVLEKATPMSIVDSIKTAASLGLEPMTDDGAIVVHGRVAMFMPMWRGYLKRIRNSGKVVDVDCQIVYENDLYEQGWDKDGGWLTHTPARIVKDADGKIIQDRGGYRGVWAMAVMPSGYRVIEWMSEAEINQIRDQFGAGVVSKYGKPLPWATSWGEMARKTVIRRLAKRLPASAVDALLLADAAADDAQRAVAKVSDGMDDLRRLALTAVGASTPVPEATPGPEPAEVEPNATTDPSGPGLAGDQPMSNEQETTPA